MEEQRAREKEHNELYKEWMEECGLEAKGKVVEIVQGHSGNRFPDVKCNTSGIIDGARFNNYDPEKDTLTIRVDHSETLSFWSEIDIPLSKLYAYTEQRKTLSFWAEKDTIPPVYALEARGRITKVVYSSDNYQCPVYNMFGNIDGAKFLTYDARKQILTIRVDHSKIPSFWLEINVPISKLKTWIYSCLDDDDDDDDDH